MMNGQQMNFTSGIKSVWVTPLENEKDAPERRIVHGRYFKLRSACDEARVGLRVGTGYVKCGSEKYEDYITDFQLFGSNGTDFKLLKYETGILRPKDGETVWFEADGGYSLYYVLLRKSGVDEWFPCLNSAENCVVFSAFGRDESKEVKREKRNLHRVTVTEDGGDGGAKVERTVSALSARFSTPYYSIGFRTKSAGLDYLSLDGGGEEKTYNNLLALGSLLMNTDNGFYTQGLVINPVGPVGECLFMSYEAEGETVVGKNSLTYRVKWLPGGLFTEIRFTMHTDRIDIDISRRAERDLLLIDSSPFRIAFNASASTVTALGASVKEGETGELSLPLTLHFPGIASLITEGKGAGFRFNAIRPDRINTVAFQCGEESLDNGFYRIRAGEYQSSVSLKAGLFHHIALKPDTPRPVREAVDRFVYTSLCYRADTDVFSNNGISMGCPLCSDLWADLCEVIGNGPYGVNTFSFLKGSLEKQLEGYPGYGSGVHASGTHYLEDEYIITGAAVLYGIGKYLKITADTEWYEKYRDIIADKLELLKKRDSDNDGLIESVIRRGVSGEHQWSTNWYDIISYGYKDAFSNAILYGGLLLLSDALEACGDEKSTELRQWAEKLKKNYTRIFMTEKGWLAGWQDTAGVIHDYGFLAVNGAAVTYGLLEGGEAKKAIHSLWDALLSQGFDAFEAGLPGNVYDIPPEDCAEKNITLPFGGYENGGLTFSQARHFINAMYKVGMKEKADFIVGEMCGGLLRGNVIGGLNSGIDWKTWDGVSCGYEGLLCDQLGIFQTILNRYKA